MRRRSAAAGAAVWPGLLLAWSGLLLLIGCDAGSFVPDRPAELGGAEPGLASSAALAAAPEAASAGPAAASPSSRAIELVLGFHSPDDLEAVKAGARIQAGLENARLEVVMEQDKDRAAPRAELIRKVVARNPLALVVESAGPPDPELGQALEEARARGLPVIVYGLPPAGPSPAEAGKADTAKSAEAAPPVIQVVPESFTPPAREMVDAAINNARNARLSPEGGALLVLNTECDRLSPYRAQALRDALRDAGISAVEEFQFDGDGNKAKARLVEVLRTNRKLGMIFSIDKPGLAAAYETQPKLDDDRPFVLAGFTADEGGANMARTGEFAAVAIYSYERLMRKSITTAAAVAWGEKTPPRVQLNVPVHVSPAQAGAPTMYKRMKERNAG